MADQFWKVPCPGDYLKPVRPKRPYLNGKCLRTAIIPPASSERTGTSRLGSSFPRDAGAIQAFLAKVAVVANPAGSGARRNVGRKVARTTKAAPFEAASDRYVD